jgi:hypothetical protein
MKCNSGWMGQSEAEARRLLTGALHGEAVRWHADDQLKVARWAFKTALMLDRSSLASRVAPPTHFTHLYNEQAPPPSVVIYMAHYFPEEGDLHLGVLGSAFRPTGIDLSLYPEPYQITFSVGQVVFEVCGHSGSALLEVKRAGVRTSGLIVIEHDVFRQLWPLRPATFEWPPQGGYLGTHNLQTLARF